MKIKIVEMKDEHHSFVIANWLQQNLFNGFKPHPEKKSYYKNHQELIKLCLHGYVAINEEDKDQFIGFVCGNNTVIHFIYVKELFRGFGIAKAMWTKIGKPMIHSHITKTGIKITKKDFTYDPYTFTRGSHDNQEK